MQADESTKGIIDALAAFQDEIGKVIKDASNPFHKSNYATLGAVWAAITPVLRLHGLVVAQQPIVLGENLLPALRTTLFHLESGQTFQGDMLLQAIKVDPQSQGAALTYARRYALVTILGLLTEEDDDGNVASGKGRRDTPAASVDSGVTPTTSSTPLDANVEPPATPTHKSRKPTAKQTAIQQRNKEWTALHTAIGDAEAEAAGRPTPSQNNMLWALMKGHGIEDKHVWASEALGRRVESFTDLTGTEVGALITLLKVAEPIGDRYQGKEA